MKEPEKPKEVEKPKDKAAAPAPAFEKPGEKDKPKDKPKSADQKAQEPPKTETKPQKTAAAQSEVKVAQGRGKTMMFAMIGIAALAALLGEDLRAAAPPANPYADALPGLQHFKARAKRVI